MEQEVLETAVFMVSGGFLLVSIIGVVNWWKNRGNNDSNTESP